MFRYQGDHGYFWVMVAVEAQHQKVVFYRSEDLKSWDFLSDFGPANADAGEWECPDLFPLAVDGDPDNIKWVLIVNINPGAVAGVLAASISSGTSTASGSSRTPVHWRRLPGWLALPDPEAGSAALQQCLWLDWGRDCYASVSFSNAPDDRRIIIGWMNNWDYANQLPTAPWRSSMTLAREVRLTSQSNGSARLIQQPVLGDLKEDAWPRPAASRWAPRPSGCRTQGRIPPKSSRLKSCREPPNVLISGFSEAPTAAKALF